MTWTKDVLDDKLSQIETRLADTALDYPMEGQYEQRELRARLGELVRLAERGWNTVAVRRLLGEAAVQLGNDVSEVRYALAVAAKSGRKVN